MAEQNQNSLGLENTSEVENVNEFKFEPIKGYPMLNWRGKRPFTSTQFYPAQLKEVYGEEVDGWRNKIYWGDNLQVMSHLLKEFRGKVDLIYIDPPYDSKADYKKKIKIKDIETKNDSSSFEEKQYTDIWANDDYLQFIYERLILLKELLSPTGSIYVHVDYRKSHHIRCIMDEIFGDGGSDLKSAGFKNEIAYGYRIQGVGKSSWARKHDTILFYSRSGENKFKPLKERIYYKKKFIDTLQDEQGRFYSDVYVRDIWINDDTAPKVELLIDRDEGIYSETNFPDIWDADETKPFISGSKEFLNYPTQKSKGLLKRIIKQMTEEGDIVFDCFMGSGTTQAVALELGRKFIGADINLGAIQTTTKRLIKVGEELGQMRLGEDLKYFTGFEIHNVNNYDIFRNPVEAKDLLLEAIEVQKMNFSSVFDGEKDGRMVKIMPINRISTKADLSELTSGFDYKTWQTRQNDNPNHAVEKVLLVCMGHEPSLKAELELAVKPFKIDVEVLDILRDKSNLEFKRDSEALVIQRNGELVIERFYPMNLLQKLSLQKETVTDWREMVESIMIDWNYDGAVLQPSVVDIPEKDELVSGKYKVPADAGTIRVKITDVLSESWEGGING